MLLLIDDENQFIISFFDYNARVGYEEQTDGTARNVIKCKFYNALYASRGKNSFVEETAQVNYCNSTMKWRFINLSLKLKLFRSFVYCRPRLL